MNTALVQENPVPSLCFFRWVMIPALLLFLSGCPQNSTEGLSSAGKVSGPVGEATFAAAQKAYLADDFARAESLMHSYQQSHPDTVQGQEARYWRGMSLLAIGRAIQARDELLRVKQTAISPRSLKMLASRSIAKSYLVEGDIIKAGEAYEAILKEYPGECDEAETLYLLSEIASRRGDQAGSSRYNSELVQKYPNSPYLGNPRSKSYSPGGGLFGGTSPDPNGRYTVQSGSFSTRDLALSQVTALNRAGLEAIIVRGTEGGMGVYIVQTGSFSTRSGAESRAALVCQKGFSAQVKP